MSPPRPTATKIVAEDALVAAREALRAHGKTLAFTNGCFDLLHSGHLHTLTAARDAADALVVAVNTDESVQRLKGPRRPVIPCAERMEVLAALACVDFVVAFDDPDPGRLIDRVIPDFLVKGGDWAADAIIGRETVEANGGRVVRVPPVPGKSTTNIVEKAGAGKEEIEKRK
ncbi:adenylyltransferase/cytidyltransferase family protein [bacterium]|nr:adenylyltransferase/cytidyltransferase family protein [bacterium]